MAYIDYMDLKVYCQRNAINSLGPSDIYMATEIWVNIGSGNGLVPDGTKPLPEPMLTYHQ